MDRIPGGPNSNEIQAFQSAARDLVGTARHSLGASSPALRAAAAADPGAFRTAVGEGYATEPPGPVLL